jgi:predicted permease
MLIVCANLSSLQMARMTSRRREMAVRTALGAARHRLLRQALTESVALSFCGALLGLVLAFAGTRALAHLTAFRLPLLASVRLDGAALAFTLLATFLTGILFGLLPAIQTPALAAQDELKDNSRGAAGSRSHTWLRNALVISEVAFACVLLVGAGLLIRSFLRVLDTDLGFRPDRAYSIRVDPSAQYKTKEQRGGYFDGVLQRVKAIPGIAEAGLTDVLPFDGDRSWGVSGKGQVYPKGHMPEAFIRIVSEGYTEAAGIPLKAGHTFTARDNAVGANVVMINESLARTLWPGQNAVGQLMNQDGGRQVVGVVGDVRHFAAEETGGNEMYIPIRQTRDYDEVELVVRTALPEATAANAVRAALRPLDPNMPLRDFRAMSSAQLVLAAQTNGKKSRGPKTPEGKRKSAANSRKHGLYAKTFHPDPLFDADFDRFLATFQSEYSPATRRQHDLVRVAAVSLARAGWAHRLAVQILKQRTKKGRSPRPPRHSLPLFRRSESPHNRHRQSVYSRKPLLQTLAKRYRPPHEIAGTNQIRSRRPH